MLQVQEIVEVYVKNMYDLQTKTINNLKENQYVISNFSVALSQIETLLNTCQHAESNIEGVSNVHHIKTKIHHLFIAVQTSIETLSDPGRRQFVEIGSSDFQEATLEHRRKMTFAIQGLLRNMIIARLNAFQKAHEENSAFVFLKQISCSLNNTMIGIYGDDLDGSRVDIFLEPLNVALSDTSMSPQNRQWLQQLSNDIQNYRTAYLDAMHRLTDPVNYRKFTSPITVTDNIVPNLIHMMWMLNLKMIPRKYLVNIKSVLANSVSIKAKVIFWTDEPADAMFRLDRAMAFYDIDIPKARLEMRSSSELIEHITSHFDKRIAYALIDLIRKESVGDAANGATVVDVLRLVALLKHGGQYFDMDVVVSGTLERVVADKGFLMAGTPDEKGDLSYGLNNCILASLPGCEVPRRLLIEIAKKYLEMNQQKMLFTTPMKHRRYGTHGLVGDHFDILNKEKAVFFKLKDLSSLRRENDFHHAFYFLSRALHLELFGHANAGIEISRDDQNDPTLGKIDGKHAALIKSLLNTTLFDLKRSHHHEFRSLDRYMLTLSLAGPDIIFATIVAMLREKGEKIYLECSGDFYDHYIFQNKYVQQSDNPLFFRYSNSTHRIMPGEIIEVCDNNWRRLDRGVVSNELSGPSPVSEKRMPAMPKK